MTSAPIEWTLFDPSGRIHSTTRAHNFREAAGLLHYTNTRALEGWAVMRNDAFDPGTMPAMAEAAEAVAPLLASKPDPTDRIH